MRSIDQIYNPDYEVLPTSPKPPTVTMPPLGGPLPPTPVTTIQTGGPLPPTPISLTPTLPSGGGTPPVPVTTRPPLVTGGPNPPVPVTTRPPLTTGGPNPPVPVDPRTMPPISGPTPPTPAQPNGNFGPAQTVNDMINSFINGPYAQNAYRRGLEQAASRGLINSSIAGGQAQRAALESIQPFVSEGMSLLNQREGRALTQRESALEREFRRLLQSDQAAQQDWLASNQYNREFNGNLSLIPIANSTQFMQYLFQMGAQDPEVFTPNVMSGMQNFFTQSMLAMLQQFFPNRGGRP